MTEKRKSFNHKLLATEEGRKEYYRYDINNPETLVPHLSPFLDPAFNTELLDCYGTDIHGDAKLRIVWAGTLEMHKFRQDENGDMHQYTGMKYPFMRVRKVVGYTYADKSGKRVTVPDQYCVPKGSLFTEQFHWFDLGIMKFAIEMKFTADELVNIGYYPKPGSDEYKTWCTKDGRRYRTEPQPNGEYRLIHFIEDPLYLRNPAIGYRDVTRHDIDQIHTVISRALNETEQEYFNRKRRQADLLEETASQEEQRALADAISNAHVRARAKLAASRSITIAT